MCVRVDKNTPNDFNTYRKVLRSIKDNITEDILLKEIREIICLPLYADRIKQDKKPATMRISFNYVLLISAVLRVLLIVYGEWQDAHMEVRYTDIDYYVFSDAASLMSSGQSPYGRTTYRYSPLLAFLLIPNAIFHHTWGKFIFSASDLLVGLFINIILKLRGVPENLCLYSAIMWFFNPFTFTIGTRGNCEPIVCAAILWIIICIMKGRVYQAAFWYGLIVHFRVYPIIYALPILLVLDPCYLPPNSKPVLVSWKSNKQNLTQSSNDVDIKKLLAVITSMFTRARVLFGLISGFVFLSLTGLFFYLYGWEFLNEALLYHLTRTDPRHNFSIYFYHIYLKYKDGFSTLEKLVSFLPQFAVQLVLVSRFALDLPFCFLVQTIAFVAFNKVITAQYFVWFFCLLPLTLPWSNMKLKWEGVLCILIWIGAQTHWLLWGYLLEFKGKNVFLQLWGAGLLFFAANVFVLIKIIRCHSYSPLFTTNAKKLN